MKKQVNIFDIIIHEHQKKIIEKRIKLNFFEELKKNFSGKRSFARSFCKEIELMVHQFYRDGIQFYGFTIDLLDLDKNDPDFWNKIHYNVEYYISDIGTRIELIEFCYLVIEIFNQKDIPYLKGIIGVRTLIGENDFLDIQVKKVFRNIHEVQNIEINRLFDINVIKNYWYFIIKENNFRFHRFTHYGEIADLELIYSEDNINPGFAFCLDEWRYSKTYQITGVKLKNPDSRTLIIYLLNLYFWHNNYKLSNNLIFKKVDKTKFSFELKYSIKMLKRNNIIIFEFLKKAYPMQLKEIHSIEIVNKDWNDTVDEILSNNHYLPNFTFKEDIIEFNDGIFCLDERKFYNFNHFDYKFNLNIILYFDTNFLSLKKPQKWLKSIKGLNSISSDLKKYFFFKYYDSLEDYLMFYEANKKKNKEFPQIIKYCIKSIK